MSKTMKLFLEAIVTLLHLQFSSAKPFNFSLKLVHRDSPESPVYPGNLSIQENILRYIKFSQARASYLMSSTYNNKNSTMHPNAVHPELLAHNLAYIVKIGVGDPVQEYWLDLDTGSGFTWIQCKPCTACYGQTDPIFDPKNSKSFRALRCSRDSTCYPWYCADGDCIYGLNYGDGSSTAGFVSVETFTFTSPNEEQPLTFDMTFGCSYEAHGNFDRWKKLAGILGMDLNPTSFMGQLGYDVSTRFAYCMVSPKSSGHSYLKFGDDVYNRRNIEEFQKTPFVKHPHNYHYYLNLQDISVNGNRLNLPKETFTIKPNGQGGCIIDSGSVLTYVDYQAYLRLRDEFERYFGRYGVKRVTRDCLSISVLCFELPPGFHSFPSITYHFDGADFYVEPKYGFLVDYRNKHFYPAITPGSGVTVIGSYQQQYTRFIYDTSALQLSFAPENCDQDKS